MKPSRLLLFGALAVAQFAAFEVGLRVKGGSEAAPAFQRLFMTDARIGYRLKPNAETRFKTAEFETDLRINSAGVRDVDLPSKPPGERRIVVLGDSLVMAIQVPLEQTFCKVLEARLNEAPSVPGVRYRVINAGVQGYGPVEEALFYEEVARRLQPDVVLAALFVGNDAMEAFDSQRKLGGTAGAAGTRSREDFQAWRRRMVRRSVVLQILRMRATTVIDKLRRRQPVDRALTMYLPEVPGEMAHGLDVTRACVERISREAAQDGARTAVVLLPARFQVDDADYGRIAQIVADSGGRLVRDAATERFGAAMSGLDLPVLDALPVLRGSPRSQEVFFQDTVHLTPLGHVVLAEGLDRFLRDSGLIAGTPVAPPGGAGR